MALSLADLAGVRADAVCGLWIAAPQGFPPSRPGGRLIGHRRQGGLDRATRGHGGGRLVQRSGRRRGLPRLAAALGEWNAYSAPQLENVDVDELLDDLADVALPMPLGEGVADLEAVLRRQARRQL